MKFSHNLLGVFGNKSTNIFKILLELEEVIKRMKRPGGMHGKGWEGSGIWHGIDEQELGKKGREKIGKERKEINGGRGSRVSGGPPKTSELVSRSNASRFNTRMGMHLPLSSIIHACLINFHL